MYNTNANSVPQSSKVQQGRTNQQQQKLHRAAATKASTTAETATLRTRRDGPLVDSTVAGDTFGCQATTTTTTPPPSPTPTTQNDSEVNGGLTAG